MPRRPNSQAIEPARTSPTPAATSRVARAGEQSREARDDRRRSHRADRSWRPRRRPPRRAAIPRGRQEPILAMPCHAWRHSASDPQRDPCQPRSSLGMDGGSARLADPSSPWPPRCARLRSQPSIGAVHTHQRRRTDPMIRSRLLAGAVLVAALVAIARRGGRGRRPAHHLAPGDARGPRPAAASRSSTGSPPRSPSAPAAR